MGVTVRMADLSNPEDADAVVRLTDAYARDEMGGGQPLPDEVKDRLVPAMLEHGNVDVLLADHEGAPIGICTLVYKFSTFSAAPTLNIHDIAVLPEHRDQGVGRKLLDTAEVLARKRGCARMNLEVLDENPAKRLYERAGFEPKSGYWVKPLTDEGESYASDRR